MEANNTFSRFIRSFLEHGEAVVGPINGGGDTSAELDAAVLAEVDRAWCLNAAFEPPPLNEKAARWAARLMYDAAQCLVYREIPADQVRAKLAEPCPVGQSPSVCRSVDLAMRVLPDLLNLARGVSPDDPLVAGLRALAETWPLSSVGVHGLSAPFAIDAFASDQCLMTLYVDRIIASRDASRLGDPRVERRVLDALGAFGDRLSPQVHAALGNSASIPLTTTPTEQRQR